jgi:hypothetical protein
MNPEPRFSLYEDDGVFGVFDSFGPQVFFAESRDRAVAEVARANEVVARFPMTISMRHLREMDAEWRAARGLPPLPEPQGRRVVVAVDPPAASEPGTPPEPSAAPSPDRSPGTGRAAPVPAPPQASAVASTLATAAEVAARLALRRRVRDARLDLDRTVQLTDELTRAAAEANAPLARFRSAISALYGDHAGAAEQAFRRLCIERGVDEAVRALADDPRSLLAEPRPRLLAGGPRAREAACEQATVCAPYLTRLDRVVEAAGRHAGIPTGLAADDPVGVRAALQAQLRDLAPAQQGVLDEALSEFRRVAPSLASHTRLRREWEALRPAEQAAVRIGLPNMDDLLQPPRARTRSSSTTSPDL